MADIKFIEAFLSEVEGPRQTQGYIPCHKAGGGSANYKGWGNPDLFTAMGASGVTIATGCDLGQTSAETLKGYGLAPGIISLFTNYYGLKKRAAINALHRQPLVIDRDQAATLDEAVHTGYLNAYVRPAYEKASGHKFDSQPREAQAVIMSVCFQKGCAGVRKDWPILWRHLCTQDWRQASRELLHGFSQYKSRRAIEGRLLARI